jgi:hypothetical protein
MDVLKTQAVAGRTIPVNREIRTARRIARPMSRPGRTIRPDRRLARWVD